MSASSSHSLHSETLPHALPSNTQILDSAVHRKMLGLALVVTAFSFSPNVAPAVQRRVAPAMPSRAGGSATLHADGLAATAVQYVIALPTMYALLSAHEYMTHRWLMHLEFNRADAAVPLKRLLARAGAGKPSLPDTGHNDHHAETNDDMTIRSDASWERTAAAKALEQDAFRGTAFDWANFAIVAVTMPVYAAHSANQRSLDDRG